MAFAVAKSKQEKQQAEPHEQVKLFITSYSDDFTAERDLISSEILPTLRSWCSKKKLKLVENFIKWGGRHPDRRNVVELERLQTSIETCYFSSVMPIFINITSSSLGWVPMWGEYSEEVVEDYQEAYGLLCEDLELMNGAFREDNLNSFFLIRDDSFLLQMPEEKKSLFAKESSASRKISGGYDRISQKFLSHRIVKYSVEFCGTDQKQKPVLRICDDFKRQILDFAQQRISVDFCGEDCPVANSSDEFTKMAHSEFLLSKGKFVLGREYFVQQIENYISREEKDVPLMLLGASGTGKTSIMCLAAMKILNKIDNGELQFSGEHSGQRRVFYHFVGAVPGSTSLEQLLKRLLHETGMTKKNSSCAKDLDTAAQMCCSMLSNMNTEPLIIFLDAANQFTKEHGARIISWIPRKLAPQVRLVLSMVTDTEVHKALVSRETKPIEIAVTPLNKSSKQGIIEDILSGDGHDKLTPHQMDMFLLKPSSENPLWLTLACQEVKLVNGTELRTKKIESLPDCLLLLFDDLLHRLETEVEGDLLTGTLCLLEASAAGLNEEELRLLLADDSALKPPSPFQEKEEIEESEKENKKEKEALSEERWQLLYKTLQPFLRPYGDSKTGRLDFYHRALSKAVRKRYFTVASESDSGKTQKSGTYYFWHSRLSEFFRYHKDVKRMIEEYPHHLACLDDKFHLAQCMCDWRVFDQLYQEEYSSQLMAYWRKVGPISEMVSSYEAALKKFEEDDAVNEAAVSLRYEKVCRVTIQAGKHQDALELLKTAMKIEEKELGARPHRMVELYALMSEIYDEKLKLNDFVSRSQLPDLRKTIHYAKKSIHTRKTLPGTYHKFKLGVSLMRLAFNMKSWDSCGGGPELTGENAVEEGNKYIDRALKIFMELNDLGHYAEALMTKGVLAKRGSMEQLKLYNQAMELCMQMYGELHILTSRLYINIGIVYEDNRDYKRSYQYFKKWARLSEEIMGPDHPKTLRAKGVLRESRYRRIAIELGEWVEDEDNMQETDDEEERSESSDMELEHNYDDTVNNCLIVSQDETSLEPLVGGSSQPSDAPEETASQSTHEQTPPMFNIIPLLPNSFMTNFPPSPPAGQARSVGGGRRLRNQPRDSASYLRSRLERNNAIRRGMSSSQQNPPQSTARPATIATNTENVQSSSTSAAQTPTLSSNQSLGNENPSDVACSLGNLLRELNMSGSAAFTANPSLSEQPGDHVRSQGTQPSLSSDSLENFLHDINEHFIREASHLFTRPGEQQEQSGNSSDSTNSRHFASESSAEMMRAAFNEFIAMERTSANGGEQQRENRFQSHLTPNSSEDSLGQIFSNGYVPSDEDERRDNAGRDDSDHEGHSDSENFYDDNFEDYDENYIIGGDGHATEDLIGDTDINEEEILALEGIEGEDNRLVSETISDSNSRDRDSTDNRYAFDYILDNTTGEFQEDRLFRDSRARSPPRC